jgi:hypothetical protein
MTVDIPDIEVNTESRGRATQTHFDAADILPIVKLEVAHIIELDSKHEFVVLLLLLPNGT